MNKLLAKEMDFEESLVEAIEGAEDKRERFKITDFRKANWAFKKLKAIEENIERIKDVVKSEIEPYEMEISRLQEWEKGMVKSYDDSIKFFSFLLEEYYREQKAIDDKFKLDTPYGKVTSRKQQLKWDYDDELILESLRAGEITGLTTKEIVERVNKNELKSRLEILEDVVSMDGIIVPSITRHGEDSFVNTDTGEIIDSGDYTYHKKAVAIGLRIIEGVKVTERPDLINIKVEV